MVLKEIVTDIHNDLVALLDEATRHGESPALLRLTKALIRLTDLGGDTSTAAPAPESNEPQPQEAAPALPALEHKCIGDIYGLCTICRKCIHQRVNGITCQDCGVTVSTGF